MTGFTPGDAPAIQRLYVDRQGRLCIIDADGNTRVLDSMEEKRG